MTTVSELLQVCAGTARRVAALAGATILATGCDSLGLIENDSFFAELTVQVQGSGTITTDSMDNTVPALRFSVPQLNCRQDSGRCLYKIDLDRATEEKLGITLAIITEADAGWTLSSWSGDCTTTNPSMPGKLSVKLAEEIPYKCAVTFSQAAPPPPPPPPTPAANLALRFDGTSQYVDIPGSSAFDVDQFTVEAWVRLSRDVGPTQARIVNRQRTQVGAESWGLQVFGEGYAGTVGNRVVFHSANCAANTKLGSNAQLVAGTWYHIAAVNDGTTLRLYVNGQPDTTTTALGTACKPAGVPIRIGSYGPLGNLFLFPGEIDDVRFWGRARTAAEIASDIRLRLTGQEAGLLGYWPFDEGSGTTTTDATGRGNHGTLVNGPIWVSANW